MSRSCTSRLSRSSRTRSKSRRVEPRTDQHVGEQRERRGRQSGRASKGSGSSRPSRFRNRDARRCGRGCRAARARRGRRSPSSSMSLASAPRARAIRRIGRRAHGEQRQKADERHRMVLDRPDAQAVRQRAPANLGKPERRLGPSAGSRARSTAIRRPPPAVENPGGASSTRPSAPRSGSRVVRAAATRARRVASPPA